MVTTGIQPITIYIGAMIMGLFTGIGSAAGTYFFQEKVKPWVEKRKGDTHYTIKEGVKKVKNYLNLE